MADDSEELERKINIIRASFAGKLAGRLLDIKQAAEDLRQAEDPPAAETARKTLNLIAHTLAGSATTFGFAEISKVAAEIEAMIEILETSDTGPIVSEGQLLELIKLIGELEKTIFAGLKSMKDAD